MKAKQLNAGMIISHIIYGLEAAVTAASVVMRLTIHWPPTP